ncbi:MAG: pyrimidine-nucleoside phosphorylase, partial [Firmicutes bacterium]|nr:pyrimidine-nucleoside phosphorylase [Bacillota bacterium]
MNIIEIIEKKRDKKELSTEEIYYFVANLTNGKIPDYQISSLLMAICINSLSERETFDLSYAMTYSGDVLDWEKVGIKVTDKHSTGGVADTTTLVLAPLVTACSLPVVKLSGRGLGHTGGTIDKLESIPGFKVDISIEKAAELVKKNGMVIMSQTADLAPADKKMYYLRDVT